MQYEFNPTIVKEALDYIDGYWSKLRRFHPHDEGTLVGLPRPYIVPSTGNGNGFEFEEMYYWDSYFIAQAFIGTAKNNLAMDMAEDLLSLMRRFGIIPNGGRTYLTSRSQPPLLTSLLWQLYEVSGNKKWFLGAMDVAKNEYRKVWMGTSQPNWRQVHDGLSRYYDANMLHDLAEAESGWDMTPRFDRECLNYLPIDLNSLLYRYEKDFEASARLNNDLKEAAEWAHRAAVRAQKIDEYMWDEKKGMYFDYNFHSQKRGEVWSLAAFYPMWVGLATKVHASRLVAHLEKFEFEGGLSTTAETEKIDHSVPEQWAYPNGWAPLQLIVIEALERYGYAEEARRIARKWLKTNLSVFQTTRQFNEKYNVVDIDQEPLEGVYPSQSGFGWTNATFARLSAQYLEPTEKLELIRDHEPLPLAQRMSNRLLMPAFMRKL